MRLIEAESLVLEVDCLETCTCRKAHGWMVPVNEVCRTIVEAPTVDAVPVVRCKDCKQYKTIFTWNGKEYKACEKNPHGDEDWFCADGERKDDEPE